MVHIPKPRLLSGSSGTIWRETSVDIAAPPAQCFEALADFASYPEWQSAVRAADVVEVEGSRVRVKFEVSLVVRSLRYVLDYTLAGPELLSWTYVDGDVRDISGRYELTPTADGARATYVLAVDPGDIARGPLGAAIGAGATRAMRLSIRELKLRAEGITTTV